MGRILVVDDHDSLRKGLVRALSNAGHEVEDASRLVAAQTPAVLSLDRGYVHVDEVAVRAAERDAQSALLELVGHRLSVLQGLCLQFFEG